MVTSTSTPGSKLMDVWEMSFREAATHNKDLPYDLLDNLTGRVKVNETFVDLEFITVPGL